MIKRIGIFLLELLLAVLKLALLPLIILGKIILKLLERPIDFFVSIKLYYPTLIYFGKFFIVALSVTVGAGAWVTLNGIHIRIVHQFEPHLLIPIGLFILSLYITIRTFVCFAKPMFYIRLSFRHAESVISGSRVREYTGLPGAGKSLSMVYDSYIVAMHQYEDLLFEGHYQKAIKQYDNFGNPNPDILADKERILKTVTESVELYKEQRELPPIPLLYSNIPIADREGHFSSKVTIDHYLQNNRVAENGVLVLDEGADLFSNQRSIQANKPVHENELLADFTSKPRHYFNGYLFFAEQDGGELFIGIRRVATARECQQFSKVCLPERLLYKQAKLRNWVMTRGGFINGKSKKKALRRYDRIINKWLFRRYVRLVRRIGRIGFFVVNYRDYMPSRTTVTIGTGKAVMPINMPVGYETRAYRNDYVCLDKKLSLDIFSNLYIKRSNKSTLFDGRKVVAELVDKLTPSELKLINDKHGNNRAKMIDLLAKSDLALEYAEQILREKIHK